MFLKNVWYVAFWSDEILGDEIKARTIIDEDVVFWRDANGEVHALEDRCPHRYAPLSLGARVEGGIRCGYHGIAYGKDGRCIANPHGPVLPALSVRSYPLVERHKMVWIWTGEPELADPSLIPDLSFGDRTPETAYIRGYLAAKAGHQLISDNILDLTHTDYLHPHTLGGGSVTRARPKVEERANSTVFIEWFAGGEPMIPMFKGEMPDPEMLTDMWTSVLWHPNGVMNLNFGATAAGHPREAAMLDTTSVHVVTPETARTTHYFFFNTREFRVDDADYNARMGNGLRNAFATEDKPMIEGQQKRLGDADLFERKPVILVTDAASTRARRVYARLLEQEKAARLAASA